MSEFSASFYCYHNHTLQNWKCLDLDQQNRSSDDKQVQPRVQIPRQDHSNRECPRASWEVVSKPGSVLGLETVSRVRHVPATAGKVYSDEAGLRSSQKSSLQYSIFTLFSWFFFIPPITINSTDSPEDRRDSTFVILDLCFAWLIAVFCTLFPKYLQYYPAEYILWSKIPSSTVSIVRGYYSISHRVPKVILLHSFQIT